MSSYPLPKQEEQVRERQHSRREEGQQGRCPLIIIALVSETQIQRL